MRLELFFDVGPNAQHDECPVMIVTHERGLVCRSCDAGAEAEYEEMM